jgi:transcriptional regulator with XRE-family HTH domain
MAKNIERAEFVRSQREERAWSQEQLAEVANVSPRTIQRLEKDGSASPETLMAVAAAFGIDVKQLSCASKSSEQTVTRKYIHLLPRLTLGQHVTNIVADIDQLQFEHDDDHDPRSVGAMKDILNLFRQDVVRLHDAAAANRINVEEELSQEIRGLEDYGYYLFGIRRVIPSIVDDQITLTSMATFYLSHSRSPKLVKDKKYMVIPAALTEVVR